MKSHPLLTRPSTRRCRLRSASTAGTVAVAAGLAVAACSSDSPVTTTVRLSAQRAATVDVVLTVDGEVEATTVELDAGDVWSRRIELDGDFDIDLAAAAVSGGPITCETTEPDKDVGTTTGDAGWLATVECSLVGEVDGNAISWEAATSGTPGDEASAAADTAASGTEGEHEWCATFAEQRVDIALDWAGERRASETDDTLEYRLAFLERNLDDYDCDPVAADAVLCAGLTEATAADANLDVWLGGARDDACAAAGGAAGMTATSDV